MGGCKTTRTCKKISKRYLRNFLAIDNMQFDFMPCNGTTGDVFILRRIQKYLTEQRKLYMCYVDLGKTFDIVLMKMV